MRNLRHLQLSSMFESSLGYIKPVLKPKQGQMEGHWFVLWASVSLTGQDALCLQESCPPSHSKSHPLVTSGPHSGKGSGAVV